MRHQVNVSSSGSTSTWRSIWTKRFGSRCGVRVLVKGRDLAAADGVDVRKVSLVGAPVGFDLPDVMTEHHDPVALRNKLTGLE